MRLSSVSSKYPQCVRVNTRTIKTPNASYHYIKPSYHYFTSVFAIQCIDQHN